MERGAWTEERLDDLVEGMRAGFARNDQDMRDLRSEMHEGFGALRGEIGNVEGSLRGEIGNLESSLRGEIDGLRRMMLNVGGGIIVALIGVIAAILARGA
jgi:hypothetical protein